MRAAGTTITITSETDRTRAVRDTARGSNNRTIFRSAAKTITQHDKDAPQPTGGQRRKGDTESGRGALRHPFRQAATRLHGNARRIARAAFKGAKPIIAVREEPPFDPFTDAARILSDTLDWMNPDNPPEAFTAEIDPGFSAQQNQYHLQL